ncbi:MAG: glycoside hydrolase [Spirochaetia bacterium]|nr:glycoside hydrolase [Spirochaetia bacterium]
MDLFFKIKNTFKYFLFFFFILFYIGCSDNYIDLLNNTDRIESENSSDLNSVTENQNNNQTETENDFSGVNMILTCGSSITEGSSIICNVSLSGLPPVDTNVTISSVHPDITISSSPITLTSANYLTGVDVDLGALSDADFDDEAANIVFTSSDLLEEITHPVTIIDNSIPDFSAIDMILTCASSITEGSSIICNVSLSGAPPVDTNVTISSIHPDITISSSPITLTSANYLTGVNVDLGALSDADFDDEAANIVFTASDLSEEITHPVTIIDNSIPDFSGVDMILSCGDSITEGSSIICNVSLSGAPPVDTNVTISSIHPDITISSSPITLTSANYSTGVNVDLGALSDADFDDEAANIVFTALDLTEEITHPVTIIDNSIPDFSGVDMILSCGSSITEGSSIICNVSLSGAPPVDTNVTISSTHPDITISSSSIMLTSINYLTGVNVDLGALSDADFDDEAANIIFTASDLLEEITHPVTIIDNSIPDFSAIDMILTCGSSITEGSSIICNVSLSGAPPVDTNVTISSTHPDITISSSPITLTSLNYSTGVDVDLGALSDADFDDEAANIVFTASDLLEEITHPVTIIDNTAPDFSAIDMILTCASSITEAGSVFCNVSLSAEPPVDTSVTISSVHPDITITPSSVTITSANFSAGMDVELAASADTDYMNDVADIVFTASDLSEEIIHIITIADNDLPVSPVKLDSQVGQSIGRYNSIDINENNIYVSYYNTTITELKFAVYNESWSVKTVDSGGVGRYSSISSSGDNVYISYFDDANNDLKFAKSSDRGVNWYSADVQTLDSTGIVGEYSAIAADAEFVYIAYFDNSNSKVKFAKSNDYGETFIVSTINTTVGGEHISIWASGERIFISYYDTTAKGIKVARSLDNGQNFTVHTVDTLGTVGLYSSIQVQNNNIYVSYHLLTAGYYSLKYAYSVNQGDTWTIMDSTLSEAVHWGGSSILGQFTSLAYFDNEMYISYIDRTDPANILVRLARSTDSGVTWPAGEIKSLANIGQPASLLGINTSLKTDQFGNLYLCYFDGTDNSLKFTKSAPGGASW